MSKHIAFFNIPAVGHVYPTLAVVAELVRRGYRVSYTTIAKRAPVVSEQGATVVPYTSTRPADTDPGIQVPERTAYIGDSLLAFAEEAEATIGQLEPAFAEDRPDLVVLDCMAFAGRILAAKWGVPTALSWPVLASNEHWSVGLEFGTFTPDDPGYLAYLDRLSALLAAHGLAVPPERFLTTPVPRRQIAFFPRSFQYRNELFADSVCFVGPCIRQQPAATRWQPPDDKPVVLVTLGTIHNRNLDFYRTCLTAFADSHWHVVLAVGERTDPAALGPAPDNVEVHQTVPQLGVLAHAAVMVNHGGMGGVMEALSYGVPVVAVPQTLEQEANAARLTELGVGTELRGTPSAPALREAVQAVAKDEAVGQRVLQMRYEILTAGGTGRAADVVEECLS